MLTKDADRALVEAAIARGLFSREEGEEALRLANERGGPVGEVLVERQLATPRQVESVRAAAIRPSARTPTTGPLTSSAYGSSIALTEPVPPHPTPAGELQPGMHLGEFEVLEKLGQGGMGAVYRARQLTLDREVALKVVSGSIAGDPAYVERFLREARAAGKVSSPHVITVFDARQVDGRLVMVLELMRGGDTAQLAARNGGRLGEARALSIAGDCARGLVALEKPGLLHRDIKPANVFITADGAAKLADLGLARTNSDDDRMTQTGMILGTPAFMAPEQADGRQDLDGRMDIYAVGATLFQLLTGEPPYVGSSPFAVVAKVLTQPAPDPRERNPQVSELTAALVVKAMAKDREERFQTPTELLAAIGRARAALGGRAPSGRGRVPQPHPAPRAPEREGPHPAAVAGLTAVLVTFLAVGISLVRRTTASDLVVAPPPSTPAPESATAAPPPGAATTAEVRAVASEAVVASIAPSHASALKDPPVDQAPAPADAEVHEEALDSGGGSGDGQVEDVPEQPGAGDDPGSAAADAGQNAAPGGQDQPRGEVADSGNDSGGESEDDEVAAEPPTPVCPPIETQLARDDGLHILVPALEQELESHGPDWLEKPRLFLIEPEEVRWSRMQQFGKLARWPDAKTRWPIETQWELTVWPREDNRDRDERADLMAEGAFFFELGLRSAPDPVGAAEDLDGAAVWLTLVFNACGDVRGWVRAIDPNHVAGERLGQGTRGFYALRTFDRPLKEFQPGQRLGVCLQIEADAQGWSWKVVVRHFRDEGERPKEVAMSGRLPTSVWNRLQESGAFVWQNVGNWSNGRGKGTLRTWVQ